MSDTPKIPLTERLKRLAAEYGQLALWVYFGIFGLVFLGFALAIGAGVEVESAAGSAGVWGAAYVATKLTQPVRIAATLALTPLLMTLSRRFGRRTRAEAESDAAPANPAD
jgi:hypothetical protein